MEKNDLNGEKYFADDVSADTLMGPVVKHTIVKTPSALPQDESLIVHEGDTLFIYNKNQKKYMGEPRLQYSNDLNDIVGLAALTADRAHAAFFRMESIEKSNSTRIKKQVFIQIATDTLGHRVFLAEEPEDISLEAGQGVFYGDTQDAHAISWELTATQDTPNPQQIYYGTSYEIHNVYTDSTLLTRDYDELLTTYINPIDNANTDWILVPTTPLYTCTLGVNDCVTTEFKDNAFNVLFCEFTRDTHECYNQYNERVFTNYQQCIGLCGLSSRKASTLFPASTTGSKKPGNNVEKPRKSSKIILYVLLTVTAVFCGYYFAHFPFKKV